MEDHAPHSDLEVGKFWSDHGDALTNAAHVEHRLRVDQLTELFRARTGETTAQDEPEPSLLDHMEKPVAAADYDLGPDSRFALNVGPYDSWDTETESQARDWMSAAGMSQSAAQTVANAFADLQRDSFKPDRALETTHALINQAYPGEAELAINAMRRVIHEAGGESLRNWLNETGLGDHPLVVREVLTLAERKGYIQKRAI